MPPFPELKDITPPTPPPFSSPEEVQAVVWQVFGAAALVLLLLGLWLWWRWRLRRATPPPLPVPALDQLDNRLAALAPVAGTLTPAVLGQQVGDAVRTYLEREHGLLARYRTTEELFGLTQAARRPAAPPPLPFLQPFAQVFAHCDALKYGGNDVDATHRAALVERALAATRDVHSVMQTPVQPAAVPLAPGATVVADADGANGAGQPGQPAAGGPPPLPPRNGLAAAFTPPSPMVTPPGRPASMPRPDSFTHPQSNAFARGADVIPG